MPQKILWIYQMFLQSKLQRMHRKGKRLKNQSFHKLYPSWMRKQMSGERSRGNNVDCVMKCCIRMHMHKCKSKVKLQRWSSFGYFWLWNSSMYGFPGRKGGRDLGGHSLSSSSFVRYHQVVMALTALPGPPITLPMAQEPISVSPRLSVTNIAAVPVSSSLKPCSVWPWDLTSGLTLA